MTKQFSLFSILLILGMVGCKTSQPTASINTEPEVAAIIQEKVIGKIGNSDIQESELLAAYNTFDVADTLDYQTVLDEILYQKRLFLEAKSQGYDNDKTKNEELETYRRIIAKSFIVDTSLINNRKRIAYQRMKEEINASHILIAVAEHAPPKDTVAALALISEIRDQLMDGASFDTLAATYSADINTKNNGGNMGWFSALQLLLPLENTAYETPEEGISKPVRSNAGYHLIKVNKRRPYSGKSVAKHILLAIPPNGSEAYDLSQKNLADSLYQVLMSNTSSFEDLCLAYSDDISTRDNGGLLEPFSVGSRFEKVFEEQVFKLRNGELSKPFRSAIGWHIVKKVNTLPLEPYSELEEEIEQRITTDSRGEELEEVAYGRFIPALGKTINTEALNELYGMASPKLLTKTWHVETAKVPFKSLIKLGNTSISNHDFIRYAEDRQSFDKQPTGYTPEMLLRWYFDDFDRIKTREVIVKELQKIDPSFNSLLTNYNESLVNSQFLNDKIYTKSTLDSLGQMAYYQKTKEQYILPQRVKATVIGANRQELIKEYFDIINGATPYRLKRGIQPINFSRNEYALTNEQQQRLLSLMAFLTRNTGYIVEVGGHNDTSEENNISALRLQTVVSFLTKAGLPITRVREYDYKATQPSDRFDWYENQRVTFEFYSTYEKDVERMFNIDKDTLQVSKGLFFKGDNQLVDMTEWNAGEYESAVNGTFYRIIVEEKYPAKIKSFKEAKGAVIAGYQKELEKQLKETLLVKYPVTLDVETAKDLYQNHINNTK